MCTTSGTEYGKVSFVSFFYMTPSDLPEIGFGGRPMDR